MWTVVTKWGHWVSDVSNKGSIDRLSRNRPTYGCSPSPASNETLFVAIEEENVDNLLRYTKTTFYSLQFPHIQFQGTS